MTATTAPADHDARRPERRSSAHLLRRLWETIRPHQGFVWLGLGLLLAQSACRLAQPYLVMTALDANLLTGRLEGFWDLLAAFLGVAVLEALFRRWQMITIEYAGQNALFDLRMRVFTHLQRLPSRFFDRTPIGRLVGRVTTDVEALQEIFSSGLVTILGDLVFLVAAVCILLSLSVPLTLATMVMVPVLLVVTLFVRKRVRSAYTTMRARLSQLNQALHEQVSGMTVVQLFGRERHSAALLGEKNGGVRDAQLRSVHWESILSAVTEMLASFTTALILWFGGSIALETAAVGVDLGDAARQGLTIGALFAFVDYMQKFFVPLNDLSLKYTVLQNAMVASERIFGLLDQPVETPDPEQPRPGVGRGGIEFRDVTFGYDDDTPVLRELSFVVEPGEKVAIVGATGAGKTTILSLITRLYELQSGHILCDGIDVREMTRSDLRRMIGVVPQDVFLFRGTILDNIKMGHPGIPDDAAIAAADRLHLDEIVTRFPNGYYEPIAERGKNLSSGEKQLIAFSRMLLVAPRVLALDEATSNVDSQTELLLQDAVHRLMTGRTALIIAHRLSTIRDVDRILVMHEGRLAEQGAHFELLERRGVYRDLYLRQYAAQEPG